MSDDFNHQHNVFRVYKFRINNSPSVQPQKERNMSKTCI